MEENPVVLANDKVFEVEKQQYLEVQKTRLEVAALNEEANALLVNYDASKVDSFRVLNQKIEALNKELEGHQQYMTNLAVQGNEDYTKPENQAIERQTSALEAETAALRQKYRIMVFGEDDPKAVAKELELIEAEKEATRLKNEALDAEIKALEREYAKASLTTKIDNLKQGKTETSKPKVSEKSKAEGVILPNQNGDNLVIVPVSMDTSPVLNVPIPVLSDSMIVVIDAYDAKLKALTNEVNRLNSTIIPQKNQTIDTLRTRVNHLEGELKGIKETNKYWAEFFQKQITSLQGEITKLTQTQTVSPAPKQVVVEKIVQVAAASTAKTTSEIISEFGISNVYFDNGKTTIKSEFNNRLNRVTTLINQHSEIVVVLKGYTDKSG
ncbi:MAG: hypothetical protein HC803_03370, partial [Saprospiraceae bacterium]|nr:hypothetical protein [Saprospiraceae bacterium]